MVPDLFLVSIFSVKKFKDSFEIQTKTNMYCVKLMLRKILIKVMNRFKLVCTRRELYSV